MKVWITKFALSSGIFTAEVEDTSTPSMVRMPSDGKWAPQYFHGEGREWHRSHAAAIVRAEEMRRKRIAGLQKSLRKLEALDFSA